MVSSNTLEPGVLGRARAPQSHDVLATDDVTPKDRDFRGAPKALTFCFSLL